MPFSPDDTIVAVATPPGRGGIGVVRISGPGARVCASALTGHDTLEPRRATLARVQGVEAADRAVVIWFQAPASYTGQDVVEISAHGSPVLLQAIVSRAMTAGARLAEPGEFTLRAYLSGRMDLVQAEAVRDLIDAVTPLQARTAFDQLDGTLTARIADIDAALFDLSARLEASLDFPEEGYHFVDAGAVATEIEAVVRQIDALLADARVGRIVREGAQVVILGRPNAGKSTLFNALAGTGRAIVTHIPGTTRDLLTEVIDIHGIPITLVDTAGIRMETSDVVEAEGVSRARLAAAHADVSVLVLDRSVPLTKDDEELLAWAEASSSPRSGMGARVVVASKADLPAAWGPTHVQAVEVSAACGTGLDALRAAIVAALDAREIARDMPAITNMRHIALLEQGKASLERARDAASGTAPEEFVAADLMEARSALEEITGRRTADDTLNRIFTTFCIGK